MCRGRGYTAALLQLEMLAQKVMPPLPAGAEAPVAGRLGEGFGLGRRLAMPAS